MFILSRLEDSNKITTPRNQLKTLAAFENEIDITDRLGGSKFKSAEKAVFQSSEIDCSETLEQTSDRYQEGLASTTITNSHERSSADTMSLTSKLRCSDRQLPPVAAIREKLSFPLKFEKKAFCLDFTSAGGSTTSDSEFQSVRQQHRRKRGDPTTKTSSLSVLKAPGARKKRFSSAEKIKKDHPFSALFKSGLKKKNLNSDSPDSSSPDIFGFSQIQPIQQLD